VFDYSLYHYDERRRPRRGAPAADQEENEFMIEYQEAGLLK
jgi:hypothetical protein